MAWLLIFIAGTAACKQLLLNAQSLWRAQFSCTKFPAYGPNEPGQGHENLDVTDARFSRAQVRQIASRFLALLEQRWERQGCRLRVRSGFIEVTSPSKKTRCVSGVGQDLDAIALLNNY